MRVVQAAIAVVLVLSPVAARAQQQPVPVPADAGKAATPALVDALAAALASGDSKPVTALVARLRDGDQQARAVLRRLLEGLQPAVKALPELEKGASPDKKAMAAPLPDELRALVVDLASADAGKTAAARDQLAASAAKGDVEVRKLAQRADGLLASCVIATIDAQAKTNAQFAGQYAALADYGAAAPQLLLAWLEKVPPGTRPEQFKVLCVHALRDCLPAKPEAAQLARLRKVATDQTESRRVVSEAGYALAQFGDRSLVDPRLKELEAALAGVDDAARARALTDLADLHYSTRDYAKAVTAYQQLLALIEANAAVRKEQENLPSLYYNACCSMALAGQLDDAFAQLDKAIEIGKQQGQGLSRKLLEVDMDIAALRKDPRFAKALAKLDAK